MSRPCDPEDIADYASHGKPEEWQGDFEDMASFPIHLIDEHVSDGT